MCLAVCIACIAAFLAIGNFATGDIPYALGWSLVVCVLVVCIVLYCRITAHERKEQDVQTRMTLTPAVQRLSPAPIACGAQVVIEIEGTFSYYGQGRKLHVDGHYTWQSGSNPGDYSRHDYLFFDDSAVPATPFREDRLLHKYRYLYTGTGAYMAVFLRLPSDFSCYSYPDPKLTITLSPLAGADAEYFREQAAAQAKLKEAEAARQATERERQQHEAAEALEAKRRNRFRAMQSRYGDDLFAWRAKDEDLTRYAREHRNELLDPKHQKEIIRDYAAFNDEDLDFAEWIRINYTDFYHRIDEVFYYRARTVAESLPKDYAPPTPPRPKLTPEERQAKFERYL